MGIGTHVAHMMVVIMMHVKITFGPTVLEPLLVGAICSTLRLQSQLGRIMKFLTILAVIKHMSASIHRLWPQGHITPEDIVPHYVTRLVVLVNLWMTVHADHAFKVITVMGQLSKRAVLSATIVRPVHHQINRVLLDILAPSFQ